MIQGSVNQMLGTVELAMAAFKKPQVPKQETPTGYSEEFKKAHPELYKEGGANFVGPMMKNQEAEQKAMNNVKSQAQYEQQRAKRVLSGIDMIKNRNQNVQAHFQQQYAQRKEAK